MFNLTIALILFLVTGLLTVTEMVPVFFVRLILFFAVVSVLGPVYGYITDFHDFAEDADMDMARPEPYNNHYLLTLLETALQQLYRVSNKVILGIWHSGYTALLSIIKPAMADPRIARSRRKKYRKASPYSTVRIAVMSTLLVYLAYWCLSSIMSHAALRLAGLVLKLLTTIVLVVISACWSYKHPTIQQIGSDIRTLLDKERDTAANLKPEPQPKQVDNLRITESNKRRAHTKSTDAPTHVSSPKTSTSPQRDAKRAYYADSGRIDPSRSARQFPLSGSTTGRGWNASRQGLTLHGSASMDSRMAPESRKPVSLAGQNTPLSTKIGQSLPYALGYLMETPRQPVKLTRLAGFSNSSLASRSSLPEVGRSTPTFDSSTQANMVVNVPSPAVNNVSVAVPPSEDILTTPERTNKLITEVRVKSNNLPMCVPKVVKEAQVAHGEDKWVAVLRRSQWKQKVQAVSKKTKKAKKSNAPTIVHALTAPERTNKLITEVRVKSNNLPMDIPQVVVKAQVACGEDKGIALLHRSQWKQKQKYLATSKKTKKMDALAVVHPSSPMDTNADWRGANLSEMDEDEVYMDMDSRRSSRVGSPMVCSPAVSPSPVQVSSPMEISSPLRVPSPMQTSSPTQVPLPAQTSAPVQVSAPVQAPALVQVPAPVAPAVQVSTAVAEAAPGARKFKELPRRKAGVAHSHRIDAPPSSTFSASSSTVTAAQPTVPSRLGHSGSGYSTNDSGAAKANGLKRTYAIYIPSTGQALPPRSSTSVSGSSTRNLTLSKPNKLTKTTTFYAPPIKPTLRPRLDTPALGASLNGRKLTNLSARFSIPEPGRALPRPGHHSSGPPGLDSNTSKLDELTRRPTHYVPSEPTLPPRPEPFGSGPSKSDRPANPATSCAPAAMTPKDLAAAIEKKATGTTGA
ncbi:hypothetical protein FRC07_004578, partial [Ceratobasidium sp. 392]